MREPSHCQLIVWRIALNLLVLGLPPGYSAFQDDQYQGQCPTFYLLSVEPYPVSDELAGIWDKAFELIPAGHLAAEQINQHSNLLPGHELKLIDIDSEACGINIIGKGIANVYRELVNPNQTCIVGVIGLFCSAVTSAISPVISHPNIGGYVHIAASTSPVHRESDHGSNLFHIIESSSVFNEATLALMHTYNWKRITSVRTESEFYFRSTADDFIEKLLSVPEYELVTCIHILDNSLADFTEKINIMASEGARISYWSVTYDEAAHLLCNAFQMNFTWPGYVYIIQEHNIGQVLQTKTSCSREEMLTAMNGNFVLEYRLYVENDTYLVSGVKYSEFQRFYNDKLKEFADVIGENLHSNLYANSLYDQVWAYALAINSSLPSLESQDLSFEDYGIGKQPPALSNIIKNMLKNVAFQGASGWIDFSENQESHTYVNIFQIQKGNPKLIGIYNPYARNVTLTEAAPHVSDVPPDSFETVHNLLPHWLGVCILTSQGLLFGLITTNLFLILKWKNEQDIKAISPFLSLLMMIGCYSLCITPVFLIANRMFVLSNTAVVKSLCYFKTWTWIGTDLIVGVLFLKLLRIYHVFETFGKTSRYWSDQYLFLYTLAICAGKAALVILWNSTGSIYLEIFKEYIKKTDQLPYYVMTVRCSVSGMWLAVTKLYSGALLFLAMVLAIETRHIEKNRFKDTKKVNAFIFLVVIVTFTSASLLIFFQEVGIQTGTDVAEWLPSFAVPLLCQMFLFFPKTLPLALKKIKDKKKNCSLAS